MLATELSCSLSILYTFDGKLMGKLVMSQIFKNSRYLLRENGEKFQENETNLLWLKMRQVVLLESVDDALDRVRPHFRHSVQCKRCKLKIKYSL